ncbi:MAG: nucleotidyltransferase [Ectothiorhodospiraceae bacterium]|nr:nucleotidyltransferase [Ectothiorhodospiraceae bacterium]
MKQKNITAILEMLRERRELLRTEFGVEEIGVFGSYARNDASEGSDLDVLVSFNRPVGFFQFLKLEETLSGWFGVKVDLVTKAALKPYIGKRILNEVEMA